MDEPRNNSKRVKYNLRRTGKQYEQLAGAYLEESGYKILQYNFQARCGEIDIIARDKEVLVFCEVKFRSGSGSGHPEDAVDYKKQRQISKTALFYLHRYGYNPNTTACRFDVVSIEGQTIVLYKDAFPYCYEY